MPGTMTLTPVPTDGVTPIPAMIPTPLGEEGYLISDWPAVQSRRVIWSPDHVIFHPDGSFDLILTQAPSGSPRPYLSGEVASVETGTYGTWTWNTQVPEMVSGAVFGMFTFQANPADPRIEFDIEFVGSDTTRLELNVHMAGMDGRNVALAGGPFKVDLGFDAAAGVHSYAVTVLQGKAVFTIDGHVVAAFGPEDMTNGVWREGEMRSYVDLWAVSDDGMQNWAGVWDGDGVPMQAEVVALNVPDGMTPLPDPGSVGPAPVDPPPVDPVPVDPVPVDPVPVDPVPIDPVPTDQTPGDPAPGTPLPGDPAPVDPAPVDPVPIDPAPVDPAPVDPLPGTPIPVDPTPAPVEPLPLPPAPTVPVPTVPSPVIPAPPLVLTPGAGLPKPVPSATAGTEGPDILSGSKGNDVLLGGAGDDTLAGGRGDDLLDGGAGMDWISYAGAKRGVTVDLSDPLPQRTVHGTDLLRGFEHVQGGKGHDRLTGDEGTNILDGMGGRDRLTGGAGSDVLIGGRGRDWLDGGVDTAADTFVFRDVRDSPAAGGGDRILNFTTGLDHIDLSLIDARPDLAGDQALTFAQTREGHAVWLRVEAEGTTLFADTNGDARADMKVFIAGLVGADDLIL